MRKVEHKEEWNYRLVKEDGHFVVLTDIEIIGFVGEKQEQEYREGTSSKGEEDERVRLEVAEKEMETLQREKENLK